jgi:outer membrane scaffolding protein for murein synthesis (MipA/OmpV family)
VISRRDACKRNSLRQNRAATGAGAFVGFSSADQALDAGFATAVSSGHNAWLWYPGGRHKLPVDDTFSLMMGVRLTRADADYTQVYFDVAGGDCTKSGYSKYKPSRGLKETVPGNIPAGRMHDREGYEDD